MDAAPTSSTPSVLIIDEDPETRDALRLLFEFENFHVVEASTAVEALTHLLRCSPEFIVFHGAELDPSIQRSLPALRQLMPEARIVACSATLEEKPPWADAFLNRERITSVSPVLVNLVLSGMV